MKTFEERNINTASCRTNMNLDEALQNLKNGKIQIEDLKFEYGFFHEYDSKLGCCTFKADIALDLLNNNSCSFKQLVDCQLNVSEMIGDKKLFEELIKNNKLTNDDLRYLLKKIDIAPEQINLCYNTQLIKYLLKNFLFDAEIVDHLREALKCDTRDWCEDYNIHNIFEMIEFIETHSRSEKIIEKVDEDIDKELLKLNELNRKGYMLNSFNLTKEQKLKLSGMLKDAEKVQTTLRSIVEANLQDTYDFETLKELLTKDDTKKLKTKFNF